MMKCAAKRTELEDLSVETLTTIDSHPNTSIQTINLKGFDQNGRFFDVKAFQRHSNVVSFCIARSPARILNAENVRRKSHVRFVIRILRR